MTRNQLPQRASIEESVLRVLYEGPASATECVTELTRYDTLDVRFAGDVEGTLRRLVERGCVALEFRGGALRYVLCPRGSERLAYLVECSELPIGVTV